MSYKTYTTEAIVCGSRVNNTSDKSFLLFTYKDGMLWAAARSVREERSRQRFALQDFSLIRVSLVKGKSGWRIGSVTSVRNYYKEAVSREGRGGVVAVVKLLRQFIHGEESAVSVYEDTKIALGKIVSAEKGKALLFQDLYMYRLLYQLGYIAKDDLAESLVENNVWDREVKELSLKEAEAVKNAVISSHL